MPIFQGIVLRVVAFKYLFFVPFPKPIRMKYRRGSKFRKGCHLVKPFIFLLLVGTFLACSENSQEDAKTSNSLGTFGNGQGYEGVDGYLEGSYLNTQNRSIVAFENTPCFRKAERILSDQTSEEPPLSQIWIQNETSTWTALGTDVCGGQSDLSHASIHFPINRRLVGHKGYLYHEDDLSLNNEVEVWCSFYHQPVNDIPILGDINIKFSKSFVSNEYNAQLNLTMIHLNSFGDNSIPTYRYEQSKIPVQDWTGTSALILAGQDDNISISLADSLRNNGDSYSGVFSISQQDIEIQSLSLKCFWSR